MQIRLELGSQNANLRKYKKLLRHNKRDSERKTARKNNNNLPNNKSQHIESESTSKNTRQMKNSWRRTRIIRKTLRADF